MYLKPCPFCGREKIEFNKPEEYYDEFECECDDCGARGGWEDTEELAAENWNKRVGDKDFDREWYNR